MHLFVYCHVITPYFCICEGEDAEDRWLYSSDSQPSSNDSHVHHIGPGLHTTVCSSCGGYKHPAHHNHPVSTHDSAAGLAKPLPTAVEKAAPTKSEELPVREKDLSSVEDDPVSESTASNVTCDFDYYVVEYVMKSQLQRVKDIEQEFGVTIQSVNRVCDEIVTVAFQRYNPTIQADNEERAKRAFLALYQVIYGRIVQRTVQANVIPPVTANDILSTISSVYKEEMFVSVNSEGLFTLVGPFESVTTVESFIRKRYTTQNVGHLHAQDHEEFQQVDEMEEFQGETDGDRNDEAEAKGPVSVFEIGRQLTVKVYSADITLSSLDVIVNAANEHLLNHAGVAAAIEKAGGDELKQDCENVVEQDGPLKV